MTVRSHAHALGHLAPRLVPGLILMLALFFPEATLAEERPVGRNAECVQSALDNEGNLHIVYVDIGWGATYYQKYNGSSWTNPTYLPNSSPAWPPFTTPKIAVGSDGRAQIVYGVNTGGYPNDLDWMWYAKANDANGSSFSIQQIGNDGTRRGSYGIAVDENNNPHICYGRTNKYDTPYWWQIIYRRPDGSEKIIDVGNDPDRVLKPDIAYRNGQIHLTWYRGGSGPDNTNIKYAVDWSGGEFPILTLTNMGYKQFVDEPAIAVAPDGHAEIVYLTTDWSNSANPSYTGLWMVTPGAAPVALEPNGAPLNEEHEDPSPTIGFDTSGNRYVGWSHYTWGECLYKVNWNPKENLSPYGYMSVCAGNGAYYVRTRASGGGVGPLYFDEIAPPAPPNQAPVALFTIFPQSGDINTVFQLDASDSYDPDNNLPLTYRWDWNDDGTWDLEQVNVPTATHSYAYPSTRTIVLEVEDTRGGRGTTAHDVTIINHDPNASFTATIVGTDSIQFDASASSDVEDGSQLSYRWDWEDDGTYDTRWIVEPQILNVFSGPGIYTVRLQVRDMLWATGETMVTIVNLAPEPPTNLQVMAVDPFAHGWGVTLSWTPSSSEDVTSQTVLRAFPQGMWEDLVDLGATTTTYQDTVYQEGVYSYRISCTNGFYVSYSDSVTIETMAAAEATGIPQTLALAGVVPNPTSGSVFLRLAIPSPGAVSVTLHDMAGRTVAARSLVVREASWVNWRWDLPRDEVPAGAYLVRLAKGNLSVAAPIVVVR